MVVKWGLVWADKAIKIIFFSQHCAIFLIEVIPLEYAKRIIFKRIFGSYAGAPVSSFLYRSSKTVKGSFTVPHIFHFFMIYVMGNIKLS
jgi:hypothetical protein